ncbi:MAG: hypothetical protein HWD63_05550 [Candidatus Parvibacillus calidus]|nr:MAG: hypothetical protein HWD63_05550 [Candidatus Parvibacillus calidus]
MSNKEKANIKTLVGEIHSLGYRVIFEKGNFQSGHCIVLDRKVIVINKFLSDKVKVLTLKDLLYQIRKEESGRGKFSVPN